MFAGRTVSVEKEQKWPLRAHQLSRSLPLPEYSRQSLWRYHAVDYARLTSQAMQHKISPAPDPGDVEYYWQVVI